MGRVEWQRKITNKNSSRTSWVGRVHKTFKNKFASNKEFDHPMAQTLNLFVASLRWQLEEKNDGDCVFKKRLQTKVILKEFFASFTFCVYYIKYHTPYKRNDQMKIHELVLHSDFFIIKN